MATLLLTAVGTALGGPIGGALGALAGQALDAKLFRSAGREGPRLTELAVQTSSYGAPIPLIFGTMRVAGTVIWSTDLIERATSEGGGKGRASTTNYTYSASFAVLLSARQVRSVARIWADGTLLRGAAGDFKTPVRFRLHLGGEAQAPDPLIASAEGLGQAPACRGQAYAVFEDLPLAEFGNRIPSLTFEVTADDAPVTCGAIVTAVSDGAIRGDAVTTPIGGYSAYGETIRGAIDALVAASGAWSAPDGERLELRAGVGPAILLPDSGGGPGRKGVRSIAAADTAPRTVTLQHYDPARDYQAGLQRVRRAGAGTREVRIDLPAALDAGAAKTLAGAALTRGDVARERRTLSLDWRACRIAPGDRVRIAGEAGLWRVVDWSLEAMVLSFDCVRIARAAIVTAATPGRVVAAPDRTAGTTVLHVFECPPIDDAVPTTPRLTIAAAGTGYGWRGADLQLSLDGGTRWTPVGRTRGRMTLGVVAIAPGPAPSTLVDRRNMLEVTLATAEMALFDADTTALDRGANLAIVGDELLQFGRAEAVGQGRWRLSELWRGRRGTEWAAGTAAVGGRFVLLDQASIIHVDLPAGSIGGVATIMATGAGDDTPVIATVAITGVSVAPPSPVHLTAQTMPDAIDVRWVRRSRTGWHWNDGIDAALVEEAEVYAIDLIDADAGVTTMTVPTASVSFDATDLVRIAVRQIGTHAPSRPATTIVQQGDEA